MCGAVPPLPTTSSWPGAYLSTGTTLPLLYNPTSVAEFRSIERETEIEFDELYIRRIWKETIVSY